MPINQEEKSLSNIKFLRNQINRSIERKGIIFYKIAEKGDIDQVTKFQKENRQLMEKVERLEVVDSTLRGEYKKVRKALEFVMELKDIDSITGKE